MNARRGRRLRISDRLRRSHHRQQRRDDLRSRRSRGLGHWALPARGIAPGRIASTSQGQDCPNGHADDRGDGQPSQAPDEPIDAAPGLAQSFSMTTDSRVPHRSSLRPGDRKMVAAAVGGDRLPRRRNPCGTQSGTVRTLPGQRDTGGFSLRCSSSRPWAGRGSPRFGSRSSGRRGAARRR